MAAQYMRYLLILFIVIPIVEMWLLIEVGQLIGAPLTIAAVVATAALGVFWLRQQGLSTLLRLNQKLSSGEMPAMEIAEGMMLAVGGALLLTPGFATDAFGFCCLFPLTRQLMAQGLFKLIQARVVATGGASAGVFTASSSYSSQTGQSNDKDFSGTSIDAETGQVSSKAFGRQADKRSGKRSANESPHDVIDGDYTRED
jgi:UPF0716 protein FxsA